jgi:TolA-binding protein
MKKTIPLLLGCFLCAMSLFADTKLGSLQAFSGDVTIDAFGKGSFLKVIKGDALYASTVLRSGPDGRATIEVQGTKQEIPPGALVRISDLVSASAKRNGLGWFAAVGKLIKSFSEASQAKEDDLVLGSRAAEVSEDADKGMEWQGDETDAAAALPTARKYIEDGGYMTALQELSKAAMPSDPRLVFELLFWKGFCYYQVGDYPDAAKNLSDAHTRTQSPGASAGTPEERGSLLFQLGSSYFFLGREKDAVPILREYIAGNPDGPYAPYATLLLARSLLASGDGSRARSIAIDAVKKYKGTDLEGEFASLLK